MLQAQKESPNEIFMEDGQLIVFFIAACIHQRERDYKVFLYREIFLVRGKDLFKNLYELLVHINEPKFVFFFKELTSDGITSEA